MFDFTQEKKKILTKRRWIILFVSCLINLSIGSIYAWSSLSAPLAIELGVDNLSIVFSVANAISFVTMIIGGILNDKYGPQWIIFGGGIMCGAGMFFCGYVQCVMHVIISYGIILGLGTSLVYGCTINNTIKFFPDKRGMVGGMTTAFYGISSVIFAPLADVISDYCGVRNTFRIIGIVALIIICVGSFMIKKCPKEFVPDGYILPIENKRKNAMDSTPLEMLKTPLFYVMLLILTCGATFGMMIISNAKGIAINMVGASGMMATFFVSVICLFNTAGRLVSGTLSDKIGRINTLVIVMLLALGGLMILFFSSITASIELFAIGVIMVGICFGTFMSVFPGFCTDQFGTKHNAVNYGIMWIGFCLAGIIGPTILLSVYEATGAYTLAFVIAMGMCIAGMLLCAVYRKSVKKHRETYTN